MKRIDKWKKREAKLFFSRLDGPSFCFFKLLDERGVCHTPLHLPTERHIPTCGYTLYVYEYDLHPSAFRQLKALARA